MIFFVNFLNISIKAVSNNTFVLFLSIRNKLKKIYSIGSLGFSHKNKKNLDVFSLLLNNCLMYLINNKISIQQLKLDGISILKVKLIKKIWFFLVIKECKFFLKYNHNGCRLKKKKRKKIGYKVKRNIKLALRI